MLIKKDSSFKRAILITIVVFSLFVSSGPIFAKEVKQNREKKEAKAKIVKGEEKSKVKTGWAFGHFIAPGWIKKNGQIVSPSVINLPFGILKKFSNFNGTSTLDTLAPSINGLAVSTQSNQAVVSFTTSERAKASIFLSTSSPVVESKGFVKVSEIGLDHKITLKNLTASTTYYFVVRVRDLAGNTTISSTTSFLTGSDKVVDIGAPKLRNVFAIVGTSTINVNWLTDEPAKSKIFYSNSLPIDFQSTSTSKVEDLNLRLDHSLFLNDLATNTKYYFVIESEDSVGNISTSTNYYMTTVSN